MERQAKLRADGTANPAIANNRLWSLVLLGLLAWQGWMTCTLFGPDHPWQRLLDEEPIISGRHCLHQYHGHLGATSFCERGTTCCYDPANLIGYLKTPVFDSGSRPAEVFFLADRGTFRPMAYKVGLAASCFLVPLFLALAARALGLERGPTCLAVALALLVWWGVPGRQALEAGDLDLLLAGLAALVQIGFLVRFDRAPGFVCWTALLATGCLGWFTHPFLFVLLIPLNLIYYLSVGTRHSFPWHVALVLALGGPLAVNAFWLVDWVSYWWIRLPLHFAAEPLLHRTFRTIWEAPLWGEPADRVLAVFLLASALLGTLALNQSRQRPAARMLGLGAGGFLALAVAGLAYEPLARLGSSQLLVPALWLAVLPAVFGLVAIFRLASRCLGGAWRGVMLGSATLLALVLWDQSFFMALASRCLGTTPLAIGLGPERAALVETLQARTTTDARILWEDRPGGPTTPRWTALLPVLTGRAFLGGLEPNACIEHAYASFVDQALAGRPIADWSDADLEDFCQRYNVGWVVCWSPVAVARFEAWKGPAGMVAVSDAGPGYLFALEPHSYLLKGHGRLLCADRQHIALADVVPEDGKVVLSMHYQAGLQASPGRVQVEREPDPYDPIPFIRLRVPEPVARITLTWEK